jgi:polysaccharide export outer membrane protein
MTRTPNRIGAITLLGILLLTGCSINRDIMFKTHRDFEFDEYKDTARSPLRLQPNDMINFRLFANDGFKLIDLVSESGAREASILQRNGSFIYFIENDGLVKLPLLGRIQVAGMTLREAESYLEERYTTYYNDPFVQVVVNNRRVVVFPGAGGDAKAIMLENNNTTLLEVLGMAGGLSKRGNAHKVKVFRYAHDGSRLVYQFDLSDIDGLKYADMVMQGDDVVYVQPNPDIARGMVQDLAPYITLLTTVVLVISLSRSIN